jgi:hypothetical protein
MQRLADLLARLGTHGAYANASRALADERERAAQVDRFLLRFAHPAGGSRLVQEPAAGECIRVA